MLNTLFFIFLVLKLIDVIGWSWWWVCSPLILQVVIFLSVTLLVFFGVHFSIPKEDRSLKYTCKLWREAFRKKYF